MTLMTYLRFGSPGTPGFIPGTSKNRFRSARSEAADFKFIPENDGFTPTDRLIGIIAFLGQVSPCMSFSHPVDDSANHCFDSSVPGPRSIR